MPSIHKEICEICLKSGVLCPACEEKIKNGIISALDIEVARILEKLKEKFKVLKSAEIIKVVGSENYVVILARKGDASKIIGKNGSVARALSKELGKQVKVVEYSEDMNTFINNLLFPASIETISIVYKKDGNKVLKIVVSSKNSKKIDEGLIKQVSHSLFNCDAEVVMV